MPACFGISAEATVTWRARRCASWRTLTRATLAERSCRKRACEPAAASNCIEQRREPRCCNRSRLSQAQPIRWTPTFSARGCHCRKRNGCWCLRQDVLIVCALPIAPFNTPITSKGAGHNTQWGFFLPRTLYRVAITLEVPGKQRAVPQLLYDKCGVPPKWLVPSPH